MVTVNCEHVLQGETTLISCVTGISNVNDEDDVFFGADGADDGNWSRTGYRGVDGIELQKHPSLDIHTI